MVIHLWGRCPIRIGLHFGSLAAALLGFSLLFQSCAVFADSIPYAADIGYTAQRDDVFSQTPPVFPTQDDACRNALIDLHTGLLFAAYTHFTYTTYPIAGDCWYNAWTGPTATHYGWGRELACPRGGLPIDRGAEVPMCGCPPGQEFPPINTVPNWNWPVHWVMWNEAGRPWCVPATKPSCPVDDLNSFPPAGDACSTSLEAGNGLANPAVCPPASVMNDPNGEPCLAQKLGSLGIPYAGPTSTIRTPSYQAHLRDVWDKFWQHQWLITDPDAYQACAAKRAIVEGEMSKHGIDYAPAPIDSMHLDGRAFDISRGTVGTLKRILAQAGQDVSGLLSEPPACNLGWGGDFKPLQDSVHFYTP